MPHAYSYESPTWVDDGKVHSRYSQLLMCTTGNPRRPEQHGQLDRLVAIMTGELEPFESMDMEFGTYRHDMFEEESKITGHIPEAFYEIGGLQKVQLDIIEQEFAAELHPGVVVHSRPDAVALDDGTIYDYKTVVDGKMGWKKAVQRYGQPSNRQATFYAMMLGIHGIEIERAVYLCEVWDAKREHILGYDRVERHIAAEDIATVTEWALDRIAILKVALEQAQATKEFWQKGN